MTRRDDDADSYSTAEVARRFGVSIPTIQRWADAGRLQYWRTPGGHRRIDAASARALWAEQTRLSGEGPVAAVVVDDNPDDRDLLEAVVQQAMPGSRVATFDNAIDALVAIGRHAPALVVTDIVMPHMDGMELVRRLAAQTTTPRPTLVVVSASLPPLPVRRKAEAQGVTFVAKPLDAPRLVGVIRALVGAGRRDAPASRTAT